MAVSKTPAKTAAKKAVAPAKAAAKPAPTKSAPAAKKPAARKPAAANPGKAIPSTQRRNYVEVAAYYIAERHGFTPGRELADWAAAEAEIDRLLAEGLLNP